MSDDRSDDLDEAVHTQANRISPQRKTNIFGISIDLRLLGIHLALTPLAVFAFQHLGLGAWRGIFVVWSVYLLMWLRLEMVESDTS